MKIQCTVKTGRARQDNPPTSWLQCVLPSQLSCLRAPVQQPIFRFSCNAENYFPIWHLPICCTHRYISPQSFCGITNISMFGLVHGKLLLIVYNISRGKQNFLYLEQLSLGSSTTQLTCNFALAGQVFTFKLSTIFSANCWQILH